MKYKAIDDILPRGQNDVHEALQAFSGLIDEAVNFGTHIIKWDIDTRLHDDSLIPILFFRNIIEIADSISTLLKASSIDASKVLLRSLLENIFTLEYMLEKDTTNRALSFIVWMTHKDLSFYEKLNGKTHSGKQFKSNFSKDKYIKNSSLIKKVDYQSAQENSEQLLKLPQYSEIEKEYQNRKLIDRNPIWYSFFNGPKNIEQLAKYLNHDAMYEVMYRGYSGNVHATNIFKGKLLDNIDGTIDIIQIRNPKDAQSVAISTINYLLMIYLVYFKIKIPSHKKEFKTWYQDFRTNFEELRKEENEIQFNNS